MKEYESLDQVKGKLRKWFNFYCQTLNQTLSAEKAGYNCSEKSGFHNIGSKNYKKLHKIIVKWLEDEGIGELELKTLLLKGIRGELCTYVRYIKKKTKTGEKLEKVERIDRVLQQKYIDMGFKMKGLYATDKIDLNDRRDKKRSDEELKKLLADPEAVIAMKKLAERRSILKE